MTLLCLSINRPAEYLSSVHFLAWERSEFQSPGRSGMSISNRIKQSKTALLLRATARMMRVVHRSGDGVRLPLFHPMRNSRPYTWLNSAPNSKSEVLYPCWILGSVPFKSRYSATAAYLDRVVHSRAVSPLQSRLLMVTGGSPKAKYF